MRSCSRLQLELAIKGQEEAQHDLGRKCIIVKQV